MQMRNAAVSWLRCLISNQPSWGSSVVRTRVVVEALGETATVVLIDQAGGPVAAIARDLKALGVGVVLVPEPTAAFEFAQACPKLALAIVNRALDPDADVPIATGLRAIDKTLPVIHFGQTSRAGGSMYSLVVPQSLTSAELLELAERTLCRRFYADDLVQTLINCAIAAVSGFDNEVTAARQALRRVGSSRARIQSVISLGGEVTGWLLVGGSEEHLKRIYQRMFPGSNGVTDADMVDLLGEIGNRTLGGIKNQLRQLGIDSTLGVPARVGTAVPTGSVPTLELTLEGRAEQINMEFCLEQTEAIASSTERAQRLLDSGRIILL